MLSLRVCLIESAPEFFSKQRIVDLLFGLKTPAQKLSQEGKYAEIARMFARQLRSFGNVNFFFQTGSDFETLEPPEGIHRSNSGKITIVLNPRSFKIFINGNDDDWTYYLEKVALTVTHELVHDWQRQRRGSRPASSNATYKHYADDPEEITAWAHDIVNELGLPFIKAVFGRFLRKRTLELQTLRHHSAEFRQFESYLFDANEHVRRRVINRLVRKIFEIAKLD